MAGTINAIAIDGITTYTSGTVVFSTASFANSNGVSFGTNGSTITASVATNYQSAGAYLTTAMASNRGSDFVAATAGFNGTNASGTIASNSISISVGNYITTGMASNRGSDFVNVTAGLNLTSISATLASNSISLSVGPYITTGALSGDTSKYVQAWELGGNTSGTTSSLQGTKLYFAGGNNITVSGNSNTITIAAGLGVRAWEITGNTAGTTSSTQTKLYFSGGQGLTISGNSQTMNFSVGSYITTGALSGDTSKYVQNWKLTGNTSGTTSSAQGTDLWFSGGNNITLFGSSNTIHVSGPNAAGAQTGISGVIVSDATYTSGTVSFSAQNNITIGSSVNGASQYIKLSVGNYITTGALSGDTSKYVQNWKLTGNTSGTTSSAQGTDLWFSGGANATVSGNSNTIVISALGPVTLSSYEPIPWMGMNTSTIGVPTATSANNQVHPFTINNYVSAGIMNMLVSMSFVTLGTSSGRQTAGFHVGLYTRMTGTDSTRLSQLTSTKVEWSITGNNSTYSISQPTSTGYAGYTLGQTTSAGVNITSLYTGYKVIGLPINTLLTPGVYFLGSVGTNSTNSINVGISISMMYLTFGSQFSGNAPMGSASSDFQTGLDQRGIFNAGRFNWASAGSNTGVPVSYGSDLMTVTANVIPVIKFWST